MRERGGGEGGREGGRKGGRGLLRSHFSGAHLATWQIVSRRGRREVRTDADRVGGWEWDAGRKERTRWSDAMSHQG